MSLVIGHWSFLRCRKVRKMSLKKRYILPLCTRVVITCCQSEGAGQGEETVGVRRRKEEKKVEDEPEDTEFTVRKSPRCTIYTC